MTTAAQLRKTALGLPEVQEATHGYSTTFSVAGEVFAQLSREGIVDFRMSRDYLELALARFPAAKTSAGRGVGLAIALSDVNGMELNSLVYKAWLSRAPQHLVAAQREAATGAAPAGPDALPKSIGKPATQALLLAGVRSLTDLAGWTEAELLALHGVGPKAVKILAQALAERETKH